jgi:hypothetical protein
VHAVEHVHEQAEAEAVSTLREKLVALAAEECNGASEYRDCAINSAKAQAMASALIAVLDNVPADEGLAPWISDQLEDALDQADELH